MRGEGETLFFTKFRRSKRGVGSVVGAVFVILIILSGFVFYQIALLTMNNYNRVTDEMNQAEWRRSNEELTILSVEVTDSNNFNITVKNTGSVQSVVIWLGIFEQSSSGSEEDQPFVSVNYPIAIGEVESIISTTQISPSVGYDIRLVTELGNIYDCSISEAVEGELSLVLVAVPATVYVNNEISIILSVTNNNLYGSVVNNVNIELIEENEITSALTPSGSQTITSLSFGATKIFNWKCTAQNIGTAQFNASYEGGSVIATVEIKEAATEPNGQGQVTITGSTATQKYSPTEWITPYESSSNPEQTYTTLSASDDNNIVFDSYYTGTITSINQYVTSLVSGGESVTNFGGMQAGPDETYATFTEKSTPTTYSFGNIESPNIINEVKNGEVGGSMFNSGNVEGTIESITFYGNASGNNVYAKAVIYNKDGSFFAESDEIKINKTGVSQTLPFSGRPILSSNTNYWLTIKAEDNKVYLYSSSNSNWNGTLQDYEDNPITIDPEINNYKKYCIYATILTEAYRLNVETQWTNVNTSMDTTQLAIFLAEQSGAENLAVEYWDGGILNTLVLNQGWNNISVTPTSPFTINFKDTTATDTVENSWSIDAALLVQTGYVDRYSCEVEFTGTSNTEVWQSILWNVETSFDTDDVLVTIQFYDYNQNAYVTSGDGYSSFLSIAEQSNLQSQTVESNFDRFRDSSGTWKVKIAATKYTSDQFTMNVDWIELQTTYESGGNTVAYGEFQEYTIKATSATGVSAAFMYASIHVNGTNIALLNAGTNQAIANPAWVQLDVNGEYRIKLQSTNSESETFVILVSVGTTVGQKTVTQEAP